MVMSENMDSVLQSDDVFIIENKFGLHARAASQFVVMANRFKSEIFVEKDGKEVNGKSIMGVMMLAAAKGSKIRIKAMGEDACDAVQELGLLIKAKFGEE